MPRAAGPTRKTPGSLHTFRTNQEESSPTERVLARVCREAGARVKFNAFLRDMNLGIRDDERCIEVLAQDLPCFKGASWQLTLLCGVLSAPPGKPNQELRRRTAQCWRRPAGTRRPRIRSF